jgi:CRP-like cAMP-binding protein
MLNKLLVSLLSGFYKTKLAETVEEREAVFRFRYKIYVEEMNDVFLEGVDHENKMFVDEYDQEESTLIVYAGDITDITASITLRVWSQQNIPQQIKERYQTNLFSHIPDLVIGLIGYFVVSKKKRGKLATISLASTLYHAAEKQNVDMVFCFCMPGLVNYYEKIGFRLYTDKLVSLKGSGLVVPMVLLPYDREYVDKNSLLLPPIAKILKKYSKNISDQKILKIAEINSIIKDKKQMVITSATKIDEMIEQSNLTKETCVLISFMSLKELTKLCGMILKIEETAFFLSRGLDDKDIYVILAGEANVMIDGVIIKTLQKGDLFGEMAFFLEQGRRQADIQSVTSLTVAIIRRNEINRIMKSNKTLAIKFLYAISKILSAKLANTTEELVRNKIKD